MARRRNKIEVLEDDFSDLTLDEKRRLMPVLQGLLRQQERNGGALADETAARNGKETEAAGKKAHKAAVGGLFKRGQALVEPLADGGAAEFGKEFEALPDPGKAD